jgi:hypothetical protein
MSELEPLGFKSGVTDVSTFSNFAVSRRRLTSAEQTVYDEAAVTWAQLQHRQKQALYIQLTDGQLAQTANEVFLRTALAIKEQAAGLEDPEIAAVARVFRRELITEMSNHQMAYYRTTAMKFAEALSEPLTPPVHLQGFWQRVAAAMAG